MDKHQRSGLEITSEIFVFEDPARINRTLSRLFLAFFLGSLSIFILANIIDWGMASRLSLGSTIAFGAVILIQRRGHPRAASLLALNRKERTRAKMVWKGMVGVTPTNAPIATPRARKCGPPLSLMSLR